MRYRAVIVENEQRSLSRMKRLLAEFNRDVEVVGEAIDGAKAVDIIANLRPDLVFLDIDLPELNGFEVLQRLPTQPAVIFTTAFSQHALEAFKTYAVDYLLKPIDSEGLRRSLEKLRAMGFNHAQFGVALQKLLESTGSHYLTRLACRVGDRTTLLKIGEILYFQSDNKYTSVYTANREYLIDTPLVALERELNPRDFVRIHRSALVNVSWIAEIRRSFNGKMTVVLRDAVGRELQASRSYVDNLKGL
jgi:two-component system, LytTR family, response regulator